MTGDTFLQPLLRNCRYGRAARTLFRQVFISAVCMMSAISYSASGFDDLIEFNPSYGDETYDASAPALEPAPANNPIQPLPKRIPSNTPAGMSKIAIIIDDIGYNYAQGVAAIALPGAITYAIIPHSPKADFFALEAQKHRKEIMLHAPMSNVHNIPLGKHGLSEGMDEARFKEALNLSLDSLPSAIGVNNHMGSLLTQKALPMEWVMQALSKRRLYFIDSRTTSNSVAWKTAQHYNIPSLKRDIFLDHTPTPEFIAEQFTKLTALAKRKGYAVAIAHPYPETIRYLKQQLPRLAQQNIALVSASELVFDHSPNLMSPNYSKNVTQVPKTLLK